MLESVKKSLTIFVYLALTLSVLLIFWQVRNFDFINYDDDHYVSANPHVLTGLSFDNTTWAFTTGNEANWHPLAWLSYMLDCQLFGPNPGLMHLENVFLHLANTLLLFAILRKMTAALWPSAFVAAVFALHPMHIQSVAWIAERKDVLSTLFLLLTLASYVGYVRNRSSFCYLLAILLFALGLLAKPMLVTLPFLLVLLDYWPMNRFDPPKPVKASKGKPRKSVPPFDRRAVIYRILIEKIPFFALAAVSSVITFLVQRSSGTVADTTVLPLEGRIANVFLSYARYMGKMFWPKNLAVFYPFDAGSFASWQVVLCVLLLLVISFWVLYLGRTRRYLPVGWFWFIVTLIPVIGLVQVGTQSMADRYTYIPYAGLFIIIAWGVPGFLQAAWPKRSAAVVGASMVIVLATLGISAYRQVSYWKNSTTLFSRAIEVTQNNYLAHCNLAKELREQGKTVLAIEHFKKSYQIAPNYPDTVNGLGCALYDHGDLNEAIEYFQKAIQVKPDSPYARNNIGFALEKEGKLNEAVAYFAQAVQIKPDFAQARNNLADALVLQGRFDEAIDQFRVVLQLKPAWPEPMNTIAWLIATHWEIKNRDVNYAVDLARHACELTGYKNSVYLGTLAAAYASAGRFPEAIDTDQKAITLAENANQPAIKDMIQYQLNFYTQGKAYIESSQQPLSELPQSSVK